MIRSLASYGYAKNNLDWLGRSCRDPLEILALGLCGAPVWRNFSLGNNDCEPDWLFCNWRRVLSDRGAISDKSGRAYGNSHRPAGRIHDVFFLRTTDVHFIARW